ncbi:glutamine--fructose-6-phosphate transaminase (isomerizing) [Tissierella creatinini]|nr:glutamine--fructose-6-phosphate transaminase (isomerizing) [Tissierella creatinini]TJX64683.1 glutamine--fructose-6-phosphate transaminase (isomerizing) [Soehngenia saccharolytica]
MCGIVGYIGQKDGTEIILEGLEKLEYRGYDSAGLAVIDKNRLRYSKHEGKLSNLKESIREEPISGTLGIGHTRWATHGVPSNENSHPHMNGEENIAVVHNGIIENYLILKKELIDRGYTFKSDTDTEIVVHLIDFYYEGDLLGAVTKAVDRLKGAYSLGIISRLHPDELIAVRYESPLILGIGHGELFVASDIPAILNRTRKVVYLENNDVAKLSRDSYLIYNGNRLVEREIKEIEWDIEAASKDGYDHFMLKEIHQQPQAIKDTLLRRIDNNGSIFLENINITAEELKKINRVYIVACGTAYHAGLLGKYMLEQFVRVVVIADIASEFRYNDNFIDEGTLVIIVSQSGETADTLAALREAKSKGARILSITNVVGSSVARESQDIFYTWAGPEIAVASTKAYTTQLVAFYILSLYFGRLKGNLEENLYHEIVNELKELPDKVKKTIYSVDLIAMEIAEKIKDKSSLFYIGRGLDYYTSLEAALKLKEISYIHAEAFGGGELKHGSIALIEEDTPVIAIATQQNLYDKTVSNIKSVKSRGAYVIGITRERNTDLGTICDKVVYLDESFNIFMPLLSVILPQLIAYYTALIKGNDVDKPRNLAKSVTVE